jgi:hypothetical protein
LIYSSSKKPVSTRVAFGDVSAGEDADISPSTSGQIVRGKRSGTFCSTAMALKFSERREEGYEESRKERRKEEPGSKQGRNEEPWKEGRKEERPLEVSKKE